MSKNMKPFPLTLVLALFAFLISVGGLAFLVSNASVSGTAKLPSGGVLNITTGLKGFEVAENQTDTIVKVAGRVLEFRNTSLVVDGVEVETYDGSAEDLALEVANGEVSLYSDRRQIELPDQR